MIEIMLALQGLSYLESLQLMMECQDPGFSFRHMLTALIVNAGLDGSQCEFLSSNMPADVQVSYFFMTEMIVDKLLPAVSKIESIVFAGLRKNCHDHFETVFGECV